MNLGGQWTYKYFLQAFIMDPHRRGDFLDEAWFWLQVSYSLQKSRIQESIVCDSSLGFKWYRSLKVIQQKKEKQNSSQTHVIHQRPLVSQDHQTCYPGQEDITDGIRVDGVNLCLFVYLSFGDASLQINIVEPTLLRVLRNGTLCGSNGVRIVSRVIIWLYA
jgi:hypothetical protein